MNTSVSDVRSLITDIRYVILKLESGNNGKAGPNDFEIWGGWKDGELPLAKHWALQHGIASTRVKLLQSFEHWQEELRLILPAQSTEIQGRVPHVMVVHGDGEQDVVGLLFFTIILPVGSPQKVLMPESGARICSGPYPVYDVAQYPDKVLLSDVRTDRLKLIDPSNPRRGR